MYTTFDRWHFSKQVAKDSLHYFGIGNIASRGFYTDILASQLSHECLGDFTYGTGAGKKNEVSSTPGRHPTSCTAAQTSKASCNYVSSFGVKIKTGGVLQCRLSEEMSQL